MVAQADIKCLYVRRATCNRVIQKPIGVRTWLKGKHPASRSDDAGRKCSIPSNVCAYIDKHTTAPEQSPHYNRVLMIVIPKKYLTLDEFRKVQHHRKAKDSGFS